MEVHWSTVEVQYNEVKTSLYFEIHLVSQTCTSCKVYRDNSLSLKRETEKEGK